MLRSAILVATLLLVSVTAPVAAAQLGGPQVPSPLTQQDPAPPAEALDLDDDGGLSTLQKVLIFGAAGAVLALIAFYIVRDARRAAPVQERSRTSSGGAKKLSARERERQQRAKRSRAKAARAQRKRNRR